MALTYLKPEKIWLKDHPEFNEAWLRDRIVEEPAILGLGDLEIKAVEKIHPKAGRLDILMYDSETEDRFEVELMLGTVNESHIIRCIEYWDIERKRYPQYDHKAVLVAENVTSRFLNIVGLFNSAIPLIAIQLNALKVNDNIVLDFVKVLDEVIPGDDDEDEDEVVDRSYWENKKPKESMATIDQCVDIIREFFPGVALNFQKSKIGLKDGQRPRNFVTFSPKEQFVRVEVKIADQAMWRQKLEEVGVVLVGGVKEGRRLKFRLAATDARKHRQLLKELFQSSNNEYEG